MAVADTAPANQAQDPFGTTGPPTSQPSDFAPAGGGPPTEGPPPPLKAKREAETKKSEAKRPAYWDADIGNPEAPSKETTENEPARRPAYWDAALQPPPPEPEAPPPPPEKGFLEQWWDNLTTPLGETPEAAALKGAVRHTEQTGAYLASPAIGKKAAAETIAGAERATPPTPDFIRQLDEQYAQSKGFFGGLDAYLENPRATLTKGLQMLIESSPTMGAYMIGKTPAAAGAAYLQTYGDTVLNTLRQSGVNMTDAQAVQAAFDNPELMSRANDAAAKAGIPAAIITAFGFGAFGKVAGPAARAVGGGLVGRAAGVGAEAATQAAIGGGGELGRQAYMGEPLNPGAAGEAAAGQALQTLPLLGHVDALRAANPITHPVVERGPANAAERAAQAAAAATPGDDLTKTVAAVIANAEVGGVHDAIDTAASQLEEQGHQEAALQAHQQEQARQNAFAQAEAAKGATPAQEALQKENAFQQAEGQQEAQKQADFSKAQGQVEAAGAETAEAGAEKGGATEPAPTLAEGLPEEQRGALQALRDRLAANKPPEEPEPTVQERMRSQAKAEGDDFQELPPEAPLAPRTVAERIAAERQAKAAPPAEAAPEAPEEAELPEKNPPAPTPQTLAERRQAQLDAAKRAKLEGAPAERPAALAERRSAAQDWFNPDHQAVMEDMQRALGPPRMTHDEAREHLSDLSDRLGPRTLNIDESITRNTASPKLNQQLQDAAAQGRRIKGVYDPETGVAHVFADAHDAGDKDDLISTAVHELTHKGIEGVVGPDYSARYNNIMASIGNDVRGSAWADRLVKQRNLDLRQQSHLAHLGDEYAAHMAENMIAGRAVHEGLPIPERAASHWQNIVDTIRQALRKLGIVRQWNDNDIAALIRQAHSYVGEVATPEERAGAAFKNSAGPRFSEANDDELMSRLPQNHPMVQGYKLGRTVEEQGKFNRGTLDNIKAVLQELGENVRDPEHVLGGLGLRNIPDIRTARRMPDVQRFVDTHDDMEGRRQQLEKPAVEFAKKWSRAQAAADDRGEALNDLISASNVHGMHAGKDLPAKYTPEERRADPAKATEERQRQAAWKSLNSDYERLTPAEKEIYNALPEDYAKDRQRVFDALNDRINATGASAETKKSAMTALRAAFERGQVQGYYSPMMRYGDWWGRALNEDGSHAAFVRLNTKAQRDQWLQAMREQGFDKPGQLQAGKKFNSKSMMERIDPDFVRNVMDVVKEADPSGRLAEDVWTEYLKAMPEMSMRKRMITRLGRLGFSGDHLQAYAYNKHHSALQVARLEYGHRLDDHLSNIKTQAESLGQTAAERPNDSQAQDDARWAPAIAKEMEQRYDWIRNPRASKWASAITRAGFNWYLGFAPATAFRIWTQNPMLAQPQLARHFGEIGATRELSRASWQWAKALGSLGDVLRGDERRHFDDSAEKGVFTDTQTQYMASGGEGRPMFRGPWYQYQRAASYLFNGIEHHNRMTTTLAAYRLARMQTKVVDGETVPKYTHDEASKLARKITWDSHFDYTNANRPRYLQSNPMKVAGLFKQYSLGVTYRLTRDWRDMIHGDTPEERLQAGHAFASTMGRMMLFAGVTGLGGVYGLPLKSLAMGMTNWVSNQMDPEHHHDAEASLHTALTDHMGSTAANMIMYGPVGALSGASLSSGASYNDLWYRPPDRDQTVPEFLTDLAFQAMGPIAAIPQGAAQGVQNMARGASFERGMEHFMPPEAAAVMKAYRYYTQGATNLKGQNVLPKDEHITNWDVATQAAGFTPNKVAEAYRRNSAVENEKTDMDKRRNDLQRDFEEAISSKDPKAISEEARQVALWNKANPTLAVRGTTIGHALQQQAKNNATAVQGLNLSRGYQYLNEKYK